MDNVVNLHRTTSTATVQLFYKNISDRMAETNLLLTIECANLEGLIKLRQGLLKIYDEANWITTFFGIVKRRVVRQKLLIQDYEVRDEMLKDLLIRTQMECNRWIDEYNRLFEGHLSRVNVYEKHTGDQDR